MDGTPDPRSNHTIRTLRNTSGDFSNNTSLHKNHPLFCLSLFSFTCWMLERFIYSELLLERNGLRAAR